MWGSPWLRRGAPGLCRAACPALAQPPLVCLLPPPVCSFSSSRVGRAIRSSCAHTWPAELTTASHTSLSLDFSARILGKESTGPPRAGVHLWSSQQWGCQVHTWQQQLAPVACKSEKLYKQNHHDQADAVKSSAAPQLSPCCFKALPQRLVPLALLPYEMPQSRTLLLHLLSLLSLKGSPRLFPPEVSLIITMKKQTGTTSNSHGKFQRS